MKNKLKKLIQRTTTSCLIPCLLMACGSAATGTGTGSSTDSTTSDNSAVFPSALVVASPLEYVEADTGLNANLIRLASSGAPVSYYAWATGRIDQLLNGTTAVFDVFDPELFFSQESNASCFGPAVDYQEHPEGSAGNSGELPTGDLGIWLETDLATTEACAKSQLEARLEGVRDRSLAASMVLASMVGVINDNSLSLPDATTPSLDLLDEMNAKMTDEGRTDVVFTTATISFDSATSGYSYEVTFTYDSGSSTHNIEVALTHVSNSSAGSYEGILSYIVDGSFMGGNCPTSDVTYNGSLQYNRTSSTDMTLEVRAGTFCGLGSDGRNSNGIIDAGDKYNAASNTDGWGNNFSIFTANYDPSTLNGNFAYTWQAGPMDSHSRVFNLSSDASSSTAFAYYGYGDDIETTDGSVNGFICNWAAPGSSHSLTEYAQYQEIAIDTTTGLGTSTLANITYAPTTTCTYDGTGAFIYDTDADGDLTDETHAAIAEDLIDGSDLDGDSNATIEEVIDASGFSLPTI